MFLCLFGVVWIESICLHLCVGTVADLWLEGDVASQRLGDGVRMCRPSLVGVGPPKYIIVPCPVASHMDQMLKIPPGKRARTEKSKGRGAPDM